MCTKRALFTSLAALCGTLLVSCGGGGNAPNAGANESEAEGESTPKIEQTCPKGGCSTMEPCAEDSDCRNVDCGAPNPEVCCAELACDHASATCTFQFLDNDGDGYLPEVCGGSDCDDSRDYFNPGEPEDCNGRDDDCDGQIDNDLASVSCGEDFGGCRAGTQSCVDGQWSECEGATEPGGEACDPVSMGGCTFGTCYLPRKSSAGVCFCSSGDGGDFDPCEETADCAPGLSCTDSPDGLVCKYLCEMSAGVCPDNGICLGIGIAAPFGACFCADENQTVIPCPD